MECLIRTVNYADQRYDTAGDWLVSGDGRFEIRVARVKQDWRYEALLAVHELIEAILCRAAGITQESVDAFDIDWLPSTEEGHGDGFLEDCAGDYGPREPGESPRAPYHRQHQVASIVERLVAVEMGVNWLDYSDVIDRLY